MVLFAKRSYCNVALVPPMRSWAPEKRKGGPFVAGLTNLSTRKYYEDMEFGAILRHLRSETGLGIKRLAPELGVTYSYLSKLENNEVTPSEEFVGRVARYFEYDCDQLLLSAGKVPSEILEILRSNPESAIEFLRKRFGKRREQP
jgi:transcriptional regulator with XRE-family HTH domain